MGVQIKTRMDEYEGKNCDPSLTHRTLSPYSSCIIHTADAQMNNMANYRFFFTLNCSLVPLFTMFLSLYNQFYPFWVCCMQ